MYLGPSNSSLFIHFSAKRDNLLFFFGAYWCLAAARIAREEAEQGADGLWRRAAPPASAGAGSNQRVYKDGRRDDKSEEKVSRSPPWWLSPVEVQSPLPRG